MPYYVHDRAESPNTGSAHETRSEAIAHRGNVGLPDQIIITFVATSDEAEEWHRREERRISDGTYIDVPWSALCGGSIVVVWTRVEGRWSAVQLPDRTTAHHYTHLSGHDGYVAYTSDDAHGVSDQCVRMRTGKYLARFFGHHYSPAEIELWTDRVKALTGDVVHFARTPDECARVFEAPSITSCMGPKKFACPVCHTPWCIDHHPVRVYGGGDTAVA